VWSTPSMSTAELSIDPPLPWPMGFKVAQAILCYT
jgi:hypothetical protein